MTLRRILATCLIILPAATATAQLAVQVPVGRALGGRFSAVVPDRGSVSLGGIDRAGSSCSRAGFGIPNSVSWGRFAESSNLSSHVWIHDLREMDRMVLDAADSPVTADRLRASGLIDDSPQQFSAQTPTFRDAYLSRHDRPLYFADRSVRLKETGSLAAQSSTAQPSASRAAASSRNAVTNPASTAADSLSTAIPLGRLTPRGAITDPDNELPRIIVVNRPAAQRWCQLGKAAEESGKPSIAKLHYRQAARYGSAFALTRLRELSK
ncbi:hypothetical protein GC176_13360 [bacterium]|nr:hypothetical protein [bacterium]